jgi:uncharacterized protein YcfJ
MFRIALTLILLASVALPARAHDDRVRAAIGAGMGAAVGSVIGSELGGRNEAILGGAIGGAVGAAIVTKDRHRPSRRYDYVEYHHHHYYSDHGRRGHRGPPHCPPGLAKQGRC